MKLTKRLLALVMAATMTVGSATAVFADDVAVATVVTPSVTATSSPTTATEPVTAKNQDAADGSTVDTAKTGTATLTDAGQTKSTYTVPETVTVKGVTYTITKIGASAFEGTKAKTVKVGKNVKTINKNAFKGSKVKTLVLKGTKAISIKKGAFKNSKVKTIKVNKKMSKTQYNKLVKALKKAGFKGKIKKAKV